MDNQAAALIVHDIKNALGVLEGELQELSALSHSERAASAWRTCSALREKMIGFLTLYKASAQGLHAHVDAVDPERFLDALIADNLHRPDRLSISVDRERMPVLGFFDEHLVGLALQAALQNAARFARSSIVLGCSKEQDAIVFSITDDGPGLDDLASVSQATPSTGLGMALCRAVAVAHCKNGRSGTCSLEHTAQLGTVFKMGLPA